MTTVKDAHPCFRCACAVIDRGPAAVLQPVTRPSYPPLFECPFTSAFLLLIMASVSCLIRRSEACEQSELAMVPSRLSATVFRSMAPSYEALAYTGL